MLVKDLRGGYGDVVRIGGAGGELDFAARCVVLVGRIGSHPFPSNLRPPQSVVGVIKSQLSITSTAVI